MRRIGTYELLEKLGAGGLGEVWKARDSRLNRVVALKFLSTVCPGSTPVADVLAEARAASALNHPNIVTIFEVGESGMGTYLVMEFVDGETLRVRLRRSRLPPRDAADIARQAAEGLAAAHRVGIVHRDLKPENIMLRVDGYVKLVDFGLAKQLAPPEGAGTVTGPTETGRVVGTLQYMAPEQVRGLRVTPASDVFSLGIVFYEMLAGAHPFESATPVDTVLSICSKEPENLSRRCPDAPPAVVACVQRTLCKEPQARYPSGVELAEDLKRALAPPPVTAPLPPMVPAAKRFRLAGIATAILALALAGGAWLLHSGRTTTEAAPSASTRSIAVLNFRTPAEPTATGASDFSANLAEDLGVALSRAGFRIPSRGTIETLPAGDARTVGGQLGVDTVLDGSIRRTGNNYKLYIELVSTRTGFQLWSENYFLDPQDLTGGNEEVAAKIVSQLRAALVEQQR